MKIQTNAILIGLSLAGVAAGAGDLVNSVRSAAEARNFTLGEQVIQRYRSAAGVTPEMAEALSWLARGALAARQFDRADTYAGEAEKLSVDLLRTQGGSPSLATALGAAIEVHSQVLAAGGKRTEAVAYLRTELARYKRAPFAARIQKNINLLSLEGKPAPPLDTAHWVNAKPKTLAELKGHPVLLFFWAHWCGDCKAEVPILAQIKQEFAAKGLVLVGPTQIYGYVAGGEEASPEQEMRYINDVRAQYYAPLGNLPVPVSEANFQTYGCSTTPTLVLLDRAGVVRLYHPGAMTYGELSTAVRRVLAAPAQP
ncbi:MAG: TlpA disulfide reductase family protein [Bryobacteraceae bacterium]